MNSTCPVTHEDLMAYRDGELSTLHRWRVARHLQRCPQCREEIEMMNLITEELRADEKLESDALKPDLRDRILAEAPAPATPVLEDNTPLDEPADIRSRKVSFRFAAVEWGAGLAICLLVMAFSVTFMGRRVSNTFNQATSSLAGGPDDSYSEKPSGFNIKDYLPWNGGNASSDSAAADKMVASPSAESYPRSPAPSAGSAGNETSAASREPYFAKNDIRRSNGAPNTDELPAYLRKVDKRADIAVEVEEVERSGATVESMVVGDGGFVSSNTLSTGANGLKTANLAVRIPVGKFESALAKIAQLGNVKAKNVTGQDMTERYSDAEQEQSVLGSELSAKEARLQQALEREKASLKNMSERERAAFRSKISWQQRSEVRELRIQTAQARARLDLLRRMSTLSSIEVELREQSTAPGQGGLLQEMGSTGRDAFSSFLIAVRIPLNLFIWILAYSPLWLPLLLIYRYLSRHYGQTASKG